MSAKTRAMGICLQQMCELQNPKSNFIGLNGGFLSKVSFKFITRDKDILIVSMSKIPMELRSELIGMYLSGFLPPQKNIFWALYKESFSLKFGHFYFKILLLWFVGPEKVRVLLQVPILLVFTWGHEFCSGKLPGKRVTTRSGSRCSV